MNLVKLDSVCEVIAGQSPPSSTYNKTGEGIPFFQGKTDFGELYPVTRMWCSEPLKISLPNDILLSVRAPVGPTNINNVKACIGRGLSAIRCSNRIDLKFLLHFLRFNEQKIADKGTGSTFKAITQKELKLLEIPLLPLTEQQKIAAILEAADSLRQKDQQLVERYTTLSQMLFLEMFGHLSGEKVPLSNLCTINPKKSEISNLDKSTIVSFVPMAKVSEDGKVDLSDTRVMADVWTGFTYFAEEDVVFAKITPCMENGKGGIMRGLKNKIGFGTTEFHVLRPKENISTTEWLYYLTKQKSFREYAEKNMTGSAGQKRVPTDFFDMYTIVTPPIALQNQFVERIKLIEAQKQQAQTSLQKSEALFNSLLQQAFTGELTRAPLGRAA